MQCCAARPSKLKQRSLRRHTATTQRLSVVVSRDGSALGLSLTDANLVTAIAEDSSASRAGVQVFDVVVGMDGQALGSRKLGSLLATTSSPQVMLELERGGPAPQEPAGAEESSILNRFLDGLLSPRSRGSGTDAPALTKTGSFASPGEQVLTIRLARDETASRREKLGITELDKGNAVAAISVDSLAHRAGLRKGDVITKVDGKDVGETAMNMFYLRAMEERLGSRPVVLTVRRGRAFERMVTFTEKRQSMDL